MIVAIMVPVQSEGILQSLPMGSQAVMRKIYTSMSGMGLVGPWPWPSLAEHNPSIPLCPLSVSFKRARGNATQATTYPKAPTREQTTCMMSSGKAQVRRAG